MAEEKRITPMATNFSDWYIDVIKNADLMDYAPVRGCIIFKPSGYAIWEAVQRGLDSRFKATGHENAYFPMLIPESFFNKEKEHVEGFAPELPWVTEARRREARGAASPPADVRDDHRLVVPEVDPELPRPARSRQPVGQRLPLGETDPALPADQRVPSGRRATTAHANEKEAREETIRMLNVYVDFMQNELAIPVWEGQKTPSEKFAGAIDTYSIEAMMKDGKAVQAGTSHYMGTKFAEAFNIQFLDRDQSLKFAHTTSWGASTRLIGCVVMAHGDDKGLKLPPRIAPVQLVMIPVGPVKLREKVMARFDVVFSQLKAAGIRVKADTREEYSPGWKYNEYEMRGVPLRLEIGPRDIDNNVVIIVRRDTRREDHRQPGQPRRLGVQAAGRDPAEHVCPGPAVPAGALVRGKHPRRTRRDPRQAVRLRAGRLVRRRRLRRGSQEGNQGHGPQQALQPA